MARSRSRSRSPSPADRRGEKDNKRKKEKKHKEHKEKRSKDDKERSSRREGSDEGGRYQPTSARAGNDSPRGERGGEGKPAAPVIQESGGEVSMSIDETNKLRISLGLKPLSLDSKSKSDVPKEVKEARERKAQEQKEAQAQALADRVAVARERRLQEQQLRSVKTLGEADDDDDVAGWVQKNREQQGRAKLAARAKAAALAKKLAEQDAEAEEDEDSDEEGGGGRRRGGAAASTAGMKIKADVESLNFGEGMIMTLEDKGLLDESGRGLNEDEEDVLENVGMREQMAREKARRAAQKAKPLWAEDGKVRGMLDKYDEEDEAQAMVLDDSGAVEAAKARRADEIKAKLAAGSAKLEDAVVSRQQAAEYYTAEEAAAMFKPKKKRKKDKVLRKKKAGTAADAEGEGALNLDELEAQAAAAGGDELGSRADREARAAKQAAAERGRASEKRARFERALEAANYASLALKPMEAEGEEEAGVLGEDEEELYQSLARARKAAQSGVKDTEDLADIAAKRRAEEEAATREKGGAEGAAAANGTGLEFTSTAEFVRSIQVADESEQRGHGTASVPPLPTEDDEDDEDDEAAPPLPPEEVQMDVKEQEQLGAGWVAADAMEEDEGRLERDFDASPSRDEDVEEDVVRERALGAGLAGTLALLRDRGDLRGGLDKIEWAGRTNDSLKQYISQLEDVYKGSEERFERSAEVGLTRRDELGRILTPKEAFRRFCHDFHGIYPSKNKVDDQHKKNMLALAKKKKATSAVEGQTADALRGVQAVTNTPYVMLSGQLKPGQISDPKSGYATADAAAALTAPTPVLGTGGHTPLVGNKKVEAMLGLRKAGGTTSMAAAGGTSSSMPPPGPKRPRH